MFSSRSPGPRSVPPVENPLLLETAVSLARKIRNREVKCEEVIKSYIDRIQHVNYIINAVVADRFEEAQEQARDIDTVLDAGDPNNLYPPDSMPLLGVPFTAKEAFAINGLPNTSGLVARKDIVSTSDATVVTYLRQAGAIPLAVTNCSELCMWYESSNNVYGTTNNAYNTGRIVGGSSGGEGCILAAGGSVVGVGSDIGGSIRMPAFFNGIFGHKPTSGIVSNQGQFPNAVGQRTEFLVTGPMCRFAEDLLPMLKIMAGPSTVQLKLEEKVDLKALNFYSIEDDGGSWLCTAVDPELKQAQKMVVTHVEKELGVKVQEVKMEKLKYSFQIWSAMMSESADNQTFCELMSHNESNPVNPYKEFVKWMFGKSEHTLPAIGLGMTEKVTQLTTEQNKNFIKMCANLKTEFENMLGEKGILFYPSHPKPAPKHNAPLLTPFNFAYTGIFNVLGFPVTQVPLGLGSEGVPLGLQVVALPYNDHMTLAVAVELEKAFGGWVNPGRVEEPGD
ncbi:PREDICTED: fatty-acid amide hydrolase 2-like [Branchiostoma belcheri]|uniref:Fatty-acid amide hydrolase 2-like n=1 Tax=Branchiostoma belcheri TaxID=7741 RepID=A0A6P5AXM0_BRABE|nr:PREDICTED: fatty-acid amide hydrolase 2-like [Branchiostoma belcheri]